LGLVCTLPGVPWRTARPETFPFPALLPTLLAVMILAAVALGMAWLLGPDTASRRSLAMLEAPPELLWGGLVLALWPARWGPPGLIGWVAAFLLAALPTELRWLCQALPGEHPFPRAWGSAVVLRVRFRALLRIAPRWLVVRVPLWITATLVLERILAVPGLGSDWMTRLANRDRMGSAVWILVFAFFWTLSQRHERTAE
jgi:hypothetical protein